MIIADTDVLIDALNGREPSAGRVRRLLDEGTLSATTITAFELLSGVRDEKQGEAVSSLLSALALFPFDEPSSTEAASIRQELEQKGLTIGMADYLIAGICVSRGVALLTRNRKHFERVRSLALSPFD